MTIACDSLSSSVRYVPLCLPARLLFTCEVFFFFCDFVGSRKPAVQVILYYQVMPNDLQVWGGVQQTLQGLANRQASSQAIVFSRKSL